MSRFQKRHFFLGHYLTKKQGKQELSQMSAPFLHKLVFCVFLDSVLALLMFFKVSLIEELQETLTNP